MEVRRPSVKIIWNGKDVTQDVSKYTSTVNYTDREEGMSDDLSILFDNSTLIWSEDWYPTEGDTIELYIGYEVFTYCGLFTVDDITLSGPPDMIEVKALAAGITKNLRTRNNKAFENLSLKQIAQFFCTKHNLQLVDSSSMLSKINLPRKTQENKTDLAFLSDLAKEYGFIFSIRGNKLVFVSYFDMDNLEAIKSFDKSDISTYSINQKTYDTYASAEFKARNKNKNEIVKVTSETDSVKTDVYIVEGDAKDNVTAEAKANAGLWNKNKFKQTANITLPGDPDLVSGVNINLTGYGEGSGKYHITTASHSSGDSYVTSLELRKTGSILAPREIPREIKVESEYAEEIEE